jgi:hypothetical protein
MRHHVTADKILKNMEVQQSSNENDKLRSLQASGRFWRVREITKTDY